MKKILLSMLALGAMTSPIGAQENQESRKVQVQAGQPEREFVSESYRQGEVPYVALQGSRVASLPQEQRMAEFDTRQGSATATGSAMVTLTHAEGNNYTLTGLWTMPESLQMTIDAETGTVTLQPGLMLNHSSYGPIWACSIDFDNRIYSSTTPISGTLADDGTITLHNWGIFIMSGTYVGSTYGTFTTTRLKPTNGTMTDVMLRYNSTAKDSIVSYPIYIEQISDNEVSIMNFSNYATPVKAMLNADGTASITPQLLFSTTIYGDFLCYPADWENKRTAIRTENLVARGNDNGLSLGNWGVFTRLSSGPYARGSWSTNITFPAGTITYPQPLPLDWSGQGTEDDPYLIANAEQLMAFAERVNGGESYKDKYIALAGDIDMSNISRSYRPVGITSPFSGTFDGRGHKVMNLTITTGEECYTGLFGQCDASSVVKNVSVENLAITSLGAYVGGVAGHSAGIVQRVSVSGEITHNGFIGGGVLGGYDGYDFSNASFTGSINGAGDTGGVVGQLRGNATSLENHGKVTLAGLIESAHRGVGGVAGATMTQPNRRAYLSLSYNDGTLNDATSQGDLGGVIGAMYTGTIDKCYNAGAMTSAATVATTEGGVEGVVGGVAGIMWGGTVLNSFNGNTIVNGRESQKVGGIVGYILTPATTTTGSGVVSYSYTSEIVGCGNFGQVRLPSLSNVTMGVYGKTYNDSIFKNWYYDFQLTGSEMPGRQLNTAVWVSGELPQGWQADVWVASAGQYPRLKSLESNESAVLASVPLLLTGGETTRKVKHDFKLGQVENIRWQLYDSDKGQFVTETSALTLDGDEVKLKNVSASQYLVAQPQGSDIFKMINVETVNPEGFVGDGSEENPYLIRDKADLVTLNNAVANNHQNFKGDHFLQTNDIDLNYATDFVGIGPGATVTQAFAGTYDGGGHTIKRFIIDGVNYDATGKGVASGSRQFAGFIGYLDAEGIVRNLTVDSLSRITAWQGASAIVGHNYGRVENCRNFATVQAINSHAAGIVAYLDEGAVVTDCYNAGAITSNVQYAAGIVSYNKGGDITYCQNDGEIRIDSINSYRVGARRYVAGIVAYNGGLGEITGNINTGAVYGERDAGGITCGMSSTGNTIKQNINYGTVEYGDHTIVGRGAVIAMSSGNTVTDNYYDSQLGYYGAAAGAPGEGIIPMLTRQLTSGEPLPAMDADRYDWAAGLYPVLKAFKDEPAAQAHRQMVVTFADEQTADDVRTSATLRLADGLQWSLRKAEQFTIHEAEMNVTGEEQGSLRDTLVAMIGRYTKVMPVRAMNLTFEGEGTAESPFLIRDKDDMLLLAHLTTDEQYSFTGRYFKVMDDIDFGTTAYRPVSVAPVMFEGDFDGNGKSFSNINYTYVSVYDANRGLFGQVGKEGCVHDLTVASGTLAPYSFGAGVAGNVYGTVTRCVNRATISVNRQGAGIAGRVYYGGVVSDCVNEGQLECSSIALGGIAAIVERGGTVTRCVNRGEINTTHSSVAGIAYGNYGVISQCVNEAPIKANSSASGIVCSTYGGSQLLDCRNLGAISVVNSSAGGIIVTTGASTTDLAVISRCVNEAPISAKGSVGGILNKLQSGAVMSHCVNIGEVTGGTSNYVGGLMGWAQGAEGTVTRVDSCYNLGKVTGQCGYVAGFAGDVGNAIEFNDCFNVGDVTATGYIVGGFVAIMRKSVANRCYNLANVEGRSGVGGVAGYNNGEMRECFNVGNVTAIDKPQRDALGGAGGVSGYGYGIFQDCYNMGAVNAVSAVAGINSQTYSGFQMHNCYNAGEISVGEGGIIANLAHYYNGKEYAVSNSFYDTDVNQIEAEMLDQMATGVTTRQLVTTQIGDLWLTSEGMYPTLVSMRDNVVANWAAAVPVLDEEDTWQSVAHPITIGMPAGTEWTYSDNLYVRDGKVYGKSVGEAWLIKTVTLPQLAMSEGVTLPQPQGSWTKTYRFTITKASALRDVTSQDASLVVKTVYYDVAGHNSDTPFTGVNIVVKTHADGSITTTKVVF
ncbi:MAG: hypothetical protein IJ808_05610 [Muribaculaceae bacterium]|nr:hypothetical protein [Muribaculaceae bacterium]